MVRSFYNSNPIDSESVSSDSVTVPDQSLSVRDILTRFRKGMLDVPPVISGPDADINDPVDRFDDLVDASQAIKSGINEIKKMSVKDSVVSLTDDVGDNKIRDSTDE